jgi:RTX calcium-binding nonapeptide repeat (4 copies)
MKTVGLFTLFLIILSMISISILSLGMVSSVEAAHKHGKNLKGRAIPIPDNPLTPPNQDPITSLSRNRIASGLELPKNLIIPTCPGGGATTISTDCCGTTSCPPIRGTNRADIIIATEVAGAIIYALEDNDVIQCGPGDCVTYGGPGDNVMMASSSNTAKLFGGSGNNVFIGSAGNSLMVGGKGDDQLYGGTGNDVMIGGGGTNYFDCGPNGNAVILDFDAKNGDTKAPNCKYTIASNTGVVPLPP